MFLWLQWELKRLPLCLFCQVQGWELKRPFRWLQILKFQFNEVGLVPSDQPK